LISDVPDIRSVWLFDLGGKPIATSLVSPVPQDLNNSDRDYFVAQRDPKEGLYVGQVLLPRIGSDPAFSVSKKRRESSREVVGVSAVVISPSVFERFYERLARNSSASYAMIRADGAVLARYPLAANPGVVLAEDSGFRRTVSTNPLGGRYTTIGNANSRAPIRIPNLEMIGALHEIDHVSGRMNRERMLGIRQLGAQTTDLCAAGQGYKSASGSRRGTGSTISRAPAHLYAPVSGSTTLALTCSPWITALPP